MEWRHFDKTLLKGEMQGTLRKTAHFFSVHAFNTERFMYQPPTRHCSVSLILYSSQSETATVHSQISNHSRHKVILLICPGLARHLAGYLTNQ